MDKCLVTKLGASVSGDFPKLGELIINISTVDITPTSSDAMFFVGSDIELRGGIKFSDDSTTGADSYANRKYLKPGLTGQLVIKNKYNLTQFYIPSTNSAVKFVDKIDIKDICYNSGITNINCAINKANGDIACLADKKLASSFGVRLDSNNLSGNIVAFALTLHDAVANNKSITNLSVRDCAAVNGSVEELIQAVRALGSTTSDGTQYGLNVSGTAATFNGNTIASAAGLKVSWTATTITYNGTTINA